MNYERNTGLVLNLSNQIRDHQIAITKVNSYEELDKEISSAISFIEKNKEKFGEENYQKIIYTLNSVFSDFPPNEFKMSDIEGILISLRNHIPNSNLIEDELLKSSLKVFFSYFLRVDAIKKIEKNRDERMIRFWNNICEKLNKVSS